MAQVDELFAEFYDELVRAAAAKGIRVLAREGYRSLSAQAAAIKKRGLFGAGGFAAPVGKSFHNYGFAVDVSITPQRWPLFGQLAESVGFRWGGRFSKPEPWHIDIGNDLTIDEVREIFDRSFLRGVR